MERNRCSKTISFSALLTIH